MDRFQSYIVLILVSLSTDWSRSMSTLRPLSSPALCSPLRWHPLSALHTWTTAQPMPITPQQPLSTIPMPLLLALWDMATPPPHPPVVPQQPPQPRPWLMQPPPPPLPSSSTLHSSTCSLSGCSERSSHVWTEHSTWVLRNMRIGYCTVTTGF